MDRHNRNLAQLQLLLIEMERQLIIISALIDRLRSRWGLPGGLQVIRQRRHRRYRFRPWSTQAEFEEEGQYSRPMPMFHLDDPVTYRNFIQMPPELYQDLEQRFLEGQDLDERSCESRSQVGSNPQTSRHF